MNTTSIQTGAPAPTSAKKFVNRMAIANAISGRQQRPPRVMIYAEPKVGKSSFAAGAPGAYFIALDDGTDELDVRRSPRPETLAEFFEALHAVESTGKANGIETLVIDPLNWLDSVITKEVLGNSGKTLRSIGGGYGEGDKLVLGQWRLVLAAIERVWQAGIGIVLVCHAKTAKFKDPEGEDYPRYTPAFESPMTIGMFKEWCEVILFAQRESFGMKTEGGKTIGGGDGARVVHTEWRPTFEAGNRWTLPPQIDLTWASLMDARAAGPARAAELLAEIEAGLAELANDETNTKVRALLAEGKTPIAVIANAVAGKVGAARQKKEAEQS